MSHPIDNQYYYGIVYDLNGQIVGFNLSPDICIHLSDEEIEKALETYAKQKQEQKPSRDMQEIKEVMECDADAETKCKMISNILTAKPHYFEKQEPRTAYCKDCKYFECDGCKTKKDYSFCFMFERKEDNK